MNIRFLGAHNSESKDVRPAIASGYEGMQIIL
jgi:hypothetical protein